LTEQKFIAFLTEGLKLQPNDIMISDIHRLPQHPVYKNNEKVNQPIIIKLTNQFNEQLFLKSLKNLKEYYNKNRLISNPHARKVYVTEHLPKSPQDQKNKLLPRFKEARDENKRATFKVKGTKYCLYIDNLKVA